ncbi:peptidoglycan editing factor PgeF [Staphylococcus hominis]|uniref:peptidoglycan editing factor PgeF n=1 Tax=Staphylococcus hominis TaxID=1290 RepID=UPI002DBDC6A8|nr:peptidoglycan editing factor PgeF [Staphylococcus hominis]MEB5791905.1 peptidoglycan editing factor PgeF [Staphylococcus hominis]
MTILKSEGGFHNVEKFIKQPHYLSYTSQYDQLTLGFTTREGGKSPYPRDAFNMARYIDDEPSHVTHHQEILANAINFPTQQWVFPIQTHENNIAHITKAHCGANIKALGNELYGIDGMYTYDSDILLTMCYADCVPVYFYSEKHHFIALAHAGWRGTYGQIVVEMLKYVEFDYQDLNVVIGPATSSTYEINDDIKKKFETLPINSDKYIETRDTDRHGIDLKLANALLLKNSGVPAENINITKYTTSEDLSLFFSYRVEKGKTGRMLAFIGQKEEV